MGDAFVGNTQLVAGGSEMIPAVLTLVQKVGIKTQRNPDVYVRVYKSFGIDEARDIRDRSGLRPVGERRVFILAMPDMTRDAQNALLKTIEEPAANALFFFIVRSPETLLSTFLSRAQRLVVEGAVSEQLVDAKKFLAAVPTKRIEMLKPLLEKSEGDPSTGLGAGKRDLGAILSFLASLEAVFTTKADVEGLNSTRREGLEAVYRARKYATDKGALVKPLLEHVALLSPRI